MKVGAAQCRALNLKWSTHNRKMAALVADTGKSVVSWDLLAGYTCPAADICNTRVVNGKLQRHGQFAWFGAVNESVHKQSFEAHQFNTKATRTPEFEAQFNADLDTLKPDIVRLFSSGDCYSLRLAQQLIDAAAAHPATMFYGYTKNMPAFRMFQAANPPNLKFVYSIGGKHDAMATPDVPTCTVVTPEMESTFTGTIVCRDHNDDTDYAADYFEIVDGRSFGIPLH